MDLNFILPKMPNFINKTSLKRKTLIVPYPNSSL